MLFFPFVGVFAFVVVALIYVRKQITNQQIEEILSPVVDGAGKRAMLNTNLWRKISFNL
jgi:hypothetical protein